MVSGFRTSPYERSRISSGEDRLSEMLRKNCFCLTCFFLSDMVYSVLGIELGLIKFHIKRKAAKLMHQYIEALRYVWFRHVVTLDDGFIRFRPADDII